MKFLFLIPLLTCLTSFGQADFNNYTTLLSAGTIPEDFTVLTYDKLKNDLAEGDKSLRRTQEKVFFEGINYAIDDLLHSGYVTYGDEISTYLEKIADKLLKKDKKSRSELRFYTLKSNSVNAFSTEQGIVFVTTGLMSQVTSEAQIAYILAHEIAHYLEHHVVESFSYKTKNRRHSIEKMSVYSKDKELEADMKGLEMYQAAGYSKDEIIPTFDVLMYSYLPFDEIDISLSYFQHSDSLFLPPSLFPDKKFEIKAIEDEDDSRSTHPNIKTRKEAITEALDNSKNWGTDINFQGDEKFKYIRNIARFEAVRNDVIEAKYGRAVYSIFLLERDFPESMYLKRMKAQTWLGLLMYRLNNKISRTIDRKSDYEGASAAIHYMIRKMNKDELEAFATRQMYDIYTDNSSDEEIKLIWERFVKTLAFGENFKLTEYSKSNYESAKGIFEINNIIDPNDSTTVQAKAPKSKYDRIKSKKDVDLALNFDSTEFRTYLLPDIIVSEDFNAIFEKYKDEFKAEKDLEDTYDAMSYSDQRKFDQEESKNRLKLGIDELIVVEPTVYSYKKNSIDRVKSEKLEASFSEVIEESSASTGIKIYPINSSQLSTEGTQSYNERSTLLNMLMQITNNNDMDPFPVDYELLNQLEENYGTTKVMFSVVEHRYDADLGMGAIYAIIFYPAAPIYFPMKLLMGNNTEINMIILDTKEARIVTGSSHYIKDSARKHTIGAHVYSIFTQLNSTK
ncbi:MAG: M48 family metalloprotease [Crocinitomicaceae bacterium]|nr:M48 family metalloprotease [Crocinitomicaceae bacterium]